MKIAIIGSGSQSPTLPPHLRELARPGVELALVQPRLSLFAFTAYERLLVDVGYVDACQKAAAEGADAIVINSFADYGIDAARAVVDVPVYGAGESALAEAADQGLFGIVTVWPASMGFLYTERLRSLRLEARCVALHHVQNEDELERLADETGVMQRMARQESDIIRTLQASGEKLMQQGANSIVLGCTCMGPIGLELQKLARVPVIEGSVAAVRAAIAGKSQPMSKDCRTHQPNLIPDLIECGVTLPSLPQTGDCPVCISTESEP